MLKYVKAFARDKLDLALVNFNILVIITRAKRRLLFIILFNSYAMISVFKIQFNKTFKFV